jgi:flagellar biosynthetic protein FliQ
MNEDFILGITHRALKVTMLIGSPMLIGSLVIGIVVSLFQAITQINEQTLVFIPKILIVGISIIVLGPWMIELLTDFTRDLYLNIPNIIAEK